MSIAADFLRDMFSASTKERVYLASLANNDAPPGEPSERRALVREPDLIDGFIKRWDRKDRGVFFCVATIGAGCKTRSKNTLAELNCVHIDIDFNKIDATPDEVEQKLRDAKHQPTFVVHSGNGLHAYWGCAKRCRPPPKTRRSTRPCCAC